MRILVITSCTGEKIKSPSNQLTQEDFKSLSTPEFSKKENLLEQYRCKAEDIYTGQQHVRLMRGVEQVREKKGPEEIDISILSAGYGLISGEKEIVPYECTFQGMKAKDLREWSSSLHIPNDVRKVLAQPYDLGLVLLGDGYLRACNLDETVSLGGPTLLFCGSSTVPKLPKIPELIPVVLSIDETRRFSCGLVGLKGEVAGRILSKIARREITISNLISQDFDILSSIDSTC